MVKLNYTARKTLSGLKAGQIVSKDLRKRIPPGSGSKAAARDSHAELDLTGKKLKDEGFAAFADDLIDCLEYRGENHPHGTVRLTELSLKGNALTTASMVKLGRVVALSGDTLIRLDLSDNEIQIANKTQRDEWAAFLESFHGCFMLKKIDFAGNKLGAAGFDVFARVYAKSDLDFVVLDGNLEDGDHENRISKGLDDMHLGDLKTSDTNEGLSEEQQLFASTRGLRSVPYLVFSNTSMTNAGAFHIWNMLMQHRSPQQLLAFLPTGKFMAPLEEATGNCGIIYTPDEQQGQFGKRLLELGMKYRERTFNKDLRVESSGSDYEAEEDEDGEEVIKKRETERIEQIELDRVTNRLVRDIIRTDGMHSVEIWSVAFEMMVVSRSILLDDEDKPKPTDNAEQQGSPSPLAEENHYTPDVAHTYMTFGDEWPATNAYSGQHGWNPHTWTEEDFPTLESSPSRSQEIKNRVQMTVSPQQQKGRAQRTFSQSTSSALNENTQYTRVPSGSALARITTNLAHLETKRFGLPMELWRQIVAEAVPGSEILSIDQQMSVLRYASDWASIKQELRIKGGTEFEQQWKILASMNCTSYQK